MNPSYSWDGASNTGIHLSDKMPHGQSPVMWHARAQAAPGSSRDE